MTKQQILQHLSLGQQIAVHYPLTHDECNMFNEMLASGEIELRVIKPQKGEV